MSAEPPPPPPPSASLSSPPGPAVPERLQRAAREGAGYWLMKSEPDEVGIHHLAAQPQAAFGWFGVRSYQARNFIRDAMRPGDLALFWHSSCPQPGIAGLCEITSDAVPDPTQFDPASPYFDAASKPDAPRWLQRDVRFVAQTRLVTPAELRTHADLEGLRVLARGNRLSVMPVSAGHWAVITGKVLGLA